jgi:hypothetical protein
VRFPFAGGLEPLLLLLVGDIGFEHIALRNLPEILLALGNVEEALRGRNGLLRGRVAMFRRNERVVALCDRDRETAARDFEARLSQRLTGLRASDGVREIARRDLPARDGPLDTGLRRRWRRNGLWRGRVAFMPRYCVDSLNGRSPGAPASRSSRDLRVGRRRLELAPVLALARAHPQRNDRWSGCDSGCASASGG